MSEDFRRTDEDFNLTRHELEMVAIGLHFLRHFISWPGYSAPRREKLAVRVKEELQRRNERDG